MRYRLSTLQITIGEGINKALHFNNNSSTDANIINFYYLIHYQFMKRINMKAVTPNTPTLLISALTLLAVFPSTLFADWGLGVSLETTQSMYKKNNTKNTEISIQASPSITYHGERVNIDDSGLSYAVIKTNKYAVDVLTTSNNRGYKAKDKDIFKGMKERKESLDLGVRLRVQTPYAPVRLAITKDIYKNKGTEIGLSIGGINPSTKHWTGKRNVSIAPIIGANWQSKKVVDYYYGVRNAEATKTRKAYKGKAAMTPFIGLEAEAKLSRHFSMTGGAKYKRLPSEITDSSITKDSNNDYQVNLGLSYWF